MESIFSRLFKYRSSDKHVQQENFLTEVFAFLLNDADLLASFLNGFEKIVALNRFTPNQLEEIKVETQRNFEIGTDKIIPDIVIQFLAESQRWLVFIENKVGTHEGPDQLKNYSDYLDKQASQNTKCALLYLTRFYDPKESPSDKVIFDQMRWWQIYEMLAKFEGNAFVAQARLFMEENGLSLPKNFTPNHIIAMMNWNETKEMMDTSLGDVVKERFEKITGGKYSSHRVNKNLLDYWDYFQAVGNYFWFQIGYFFANSDDEDFPTVGSAIVVEPHYPNRPQAILAFNKFVEKNNGWKLVGNFDSETETIWITKGQSFKEFINSDNHINTIQKLFLEVLADVETFQNDNPDLSWD